jgi:hypothetical protein
MSTPYSLYLVTTGGHEFVITVQEGKGMFERPVQKKDGLNIHLNGYEANRWAEFLNVMIMVAVYKRVYK